MDPEEVKDVQEAIDEIRSFDGDRYYSLANTLSQLWINYENPLGPKWDELKAALEENSTIARGEELQRYLESFFGSSAPSWWPF